MNLIEEIGPLSFQANPNVTHDPSYDSISWRQIPVVACYEHYQMAACQLPNMSSTGQPRSLRTDLSMLTNARASFWANRERYLMDCRLPPRTDSLLSTSSLTPRRSTFQECDHMPSSSTSPHGVILTPLLIAKSGGRLCLHCTKYPPRRLQFSGATGMAAGELRLLGRAWNIWGDHGTCE